MKNDVRFSILRQEGRAMFMEKNKKDILSKGGECLAENRKVLGARKKYFLEVFDKRGFGTIIGRGKIYRLKKVWKP